MFNRDTGNSDFYGSASIYHTNEIDPEQDRETEHHAIPARDKKTAPSIDSGRLAYDMLLLQQRLVAYEQLHLEEIAELKKEIERLRRAFLQLSI
jgi:hypothetical protein